MPPVTATENDVLYYTQTLIFQLSRKLRIKLFMSMVLGQYNLTQQASK